MFDMASEIDQHSDFAEALMKEGWTINQHPRLFAQLNHSEILEEFIKVVLVPLEDNATLHLLPPGI